MATEFSDVDSQLVLSNVDVGTAGFTAGNYLSSNNNVKDGIWSITYQNYCSWVQVNFTGSPVGTLSVEGSADGKNWVPVSPDNEPKLAVNGSTSPYVVNFGYLANFYFRIKYVRTSGSGTMSVWVGSK
jgi:hypothetical protein